ncbi:SLBB domain-containing protein [Tellurirhabdus rosea]|uniref:SLBB domain-containing protein n=1 Tax=Tellurirhabdus rosea TaxID=2674997 RepID=UPI00225777D3|nr:SLBB domain-containing protein [Tellurirhabdus rosea]
MPFISPENCVGSRRITAVLLVLFQTCCFVSHAQKRAELTPEQLRQFVLSAKASGLTEKQMEDLARTRGFTAADLTELRQRLESEQKPQSVESPAPPVSRTLPADLTPPVPLSSKKPDEPTQVPVFGAALFSGSSLTFEPNLRLATPRNYQLGPDDELQIEIYGNAQHSYRPKISPEGTIRLESLSPIFVSGLTIEQAEQRIVGRLRQLFAGLNTAAAGVYAQVTLGNIRSIKVTLMGQVVKPGTYTLSSLATVFNALYAAGGPDAERGSFRDIRVIRGNRLVRTLDIYAFLLRADQTDNIRLQDQDIVLVNHYDTRIELAGEVRQPGLYELRKGETLRHALAFAGGYTDKAYTASLTLRRATDRELEIGTLTAAEVPSFVPRRGDRYWVGAILDRYENRVSIRGAVFRPGEYALNRTQTLAGLIRSAEGLREDAFLSRATVRRLRPNLDPEILSVDLGRLMRGETADLPLQREDEVVVQSVSDVRERRTVRIEGAVNRPGEFLFADSLTVASLVLLAGGFQEGATASRIEIARRVKDDTTGLPSGQDVRLIQLELDESLRLTEADAHRVLKPFDEVFVRRSPRYEPQRKVYIGGEVTYPGTYVIRDKNERIADLIHRAGGVRPGAFLAAARFNRLGEPISVNLQQVLAEPSVTGNLLLLAGDSLVIPRRVETVRITGAVLTPVTVDFNPEKSLRSYIDEAGGFRREARRGQTYVTYANGRIGRTRHVLWVRNYPKPEPGMVLTVPARPSKDEKRLTPTERIALATGLTSLVAVLLTVVRMAGGQ